MKTKFTEQQLQQIFNLFKQDFGSRKIAKIINCNRSTIIRAYKQLNLNSINKKTPRFTYKTIEKCCKICNTIKSIDQFRKRFRNKRVSFESYCLNCEKQANKERLKLRAKILRKIDPNFYIRRSISFFIWKVLKSSSNSKNNKSCLTYINYTIEELKEHLENQFESWMTWKNYGAYRKDTWNDIDPSTWTWQIDHIIPQSTLPYSSMEDENFKKCWSLENLKPLSAKQNLLDGVTRIRHKKV